MQKFDQSPYYAAVVNRLKCNGILTVNIIVSTCVELNERTNERCRKKPLNYQLNLAKRWK